MEFASDQASSIKKLSAMIGSNDGTGSAAESNKSFKYKFVGITEFLESMGNADCLSKTDGPDFGEWDMQSEAQTEAQEDM